MTKKDYEIKIAAAKSNKVLNDKQRAQIVAMYEKKISELEPAKKAERGTPKFKVGDMVSFKKDGFDGFPFKVLKSEYWTSKREYDYTFKTGDGSFIEGLESELQAYKASSKKDEPAKKAEPKTSVEKDLADIKAYFSESITVPEMQVILTRISKKYDLKDSSDKGLKALAEKLSKKDSKKIDYDCDDLIAKAKKTAAAAKERAKAPKKTEVTKSKETIEKVHDKVQKNVEAGKFGKAQLQKLITETEDLLTFLKKTLKSL